MTLSKKSHKSSLRHYNLLVNCKKRTVNRQHLSRRQRNVPNLQKQLLSN